MRLRAFLPSEPILPLTTSYSGFNVGFHSGGTIVPFESLSIYKGSRTSKSSGDKLVNCPLTTLGLPASSNSRHQGPVAPNRERVSGLIDFGFCPNKLSILANKVPEAKELLQLSTPYPN